MSNGVMIALLPTSTEWCKIGLPHMTLVYVGQTDELPYTVYNELGKDASALTMMNRPITLRVKGVDVFGEGTADNPKVDVFKLEPTSELLAMRRMVERWNNSEFDFIPHVTVGPQGQYLSEVPFSITFDRIVVGWGDEYLTFWLKR